MNWQPIVTGAGLVLKEVAASFGPIPSAVADFAVDAITSAITGVANGDDAVKIVEAIENQTGDLLAKLKTGQ